tara:strand:- start:1170 stop:1376 length:207 start_codon:yes stop_codon:yes gene_type:complete
MQWTDIAGIVLVFLTITSLILGGLMWFIRTVVRQELEKCTRTIQPGYRNGGESLADIAHKLDEISRRI